MNQAQPVDRLLRFAFTQLFHDRLDSRVRVADDIHPELLARDAIPALLYHPLVSEPQWQPVAEEHGPGDRLHPLDRWLVSTDHDDCVMFLPAVDAADGVEVCKVDIARYLDSCPDLGAAVPGDRLRSDHQQLGMLLGEACDES